MRTLIIAGLVALLAVMVGLLYHFSQAMAEESSVSKEVVYNSLRERILPLRIYKSLVQMRTQIRNGEKPSADDLKALDGHRTRMNTLLDGFVRGGMIKAVTGRDAVLRPIETQVARETVRGVEKVWVPLDTDISEIVASGAADLTRIEKAIAYLDKNSQVFDTASEALTTEEYAYNAARMSSLEIPRNIVAVLLAVGAGLVIPVTVLLGRVRSSADALSQTVSQLEQTTKDLETSSAELARSKQQSDLILDTVLQGLILIDQKGVIGDKYSREVEAIFRMNNLAGMNLLNLLQRLLTEKMYNTTRDYFELLFNKALKERQVLKVNPLEELEVNFSKPEGGFVTRYLGFSFRRIMRDGEVEQVLVTVNDVTQRVQLEQELRASEKRKERQFDLLLGILHVEPAQVREFIVTTGQELDSLNGVLKAEDFAQATGGGSKADQLRKTLDIVFRHVHNIKGRASYLQLTYFERVVGEFEEKIHLLRHRPVLTGDDFLALVIAQSELRNDLTELQDISQRLSGIRQPSMQIGTGAPTRAQQLALPENEKANAGGGKPGKPTNGVVAPGDDIIAGLANLANTIAGRQEKKVRLETSEFDVNAFRTDIHQTIRDVLIQLVRNAVTHGIETPEERKKAGKDVEGVITIALLYNQEGGVEGIHFMDDGRGLDYSKILRRAIDMDMIAEADAAKYDHDALAGLIFHPGFSTSEGVTVDAGRGVGMDFVYNAIVEQCGGEIAVCSEPKINCEYYFRLGSRNLAGAEEDADAESSRTAALRN
ncbi:hypothetical protein DB346_09580 [Verrucomicrobia bacterium LW23]|nr:hypothetical protein DB346_09580 [Verrucomicrobia bacterium LW23]